MLVAGHYLADYALQTEFMAKSKRSVFIKSEGFHALTAHAFIHGLTAGLLSQRLSIGVIVGITHWLIDFGKATKNWYGINVDQFLHISVILIAVFFIAT
jgi:hypothetical protein